MVRTRSGSGNVVTTTRKEGRGKVKKRTSRKTFVVSMLIIITALLLAMSPVFNITMITVEGNSKIVSENITAASGIEKGINIFKANLSKAETNISMMPYVDSVVVKRVLPGRINILVTESKPMAYIPFIGSYICIDGKGKIVEVFSSLEEKNLPLILGLSFSEFTIGQKIKVEDEKKLELVEMCIKEINHNNMLQQVTEIDVNDASNIRLKIRDNIDVDLGDGSHINYRMSFLKSILGELGENEKGYIDLRSEDRVIFRGQ